MTNKLDLLLLAGSRKKSELSLARNQADMGTTLDFARSRYGLMVHDDEEGPIPMLRSTVKRYILSQSFNKVYLLGPKDNFSMVSDLPNVHNLATDSTLKENLEFAIQELSPGFLAVSAADILPNAAEVNNLVQAVGNLEHASLVLPFVPIKYLNEKKNGFSLDGERQHFSHLFFADFSNLYQFTALGLLEKFYSASGSPGRSQEKPKYVSKGLWGIYRGIFLAQAVFMLNYKSLQNARKDGGENLPHIKEGINSILSLNFPNSDASSAYLETVMQNMMVRNGKAYLITNVNAPSLAQDVDKAAQLSAHAY